MKKSEGVSIRKMFLEVRPNSYLEIFKSDSPTLITIRKKQGDEATLQDLAYCITYITGLANVIRPMTKEQIIETSYKLINDFGVFKIIDIKYCLMNGIEGKYGKIMDRLDYSIILEWFNKYFDERMQAGENESYEKHIKSKEINESLSYKFPEQEAVRKKTSYGGKRFFEKKAKTQL